jgi:GcrA cell cycle regulator
MTWTVERTDLLKKRWAEGATGTQIAAELGISRNSVIGKAHRLGLAARAASPAPTPRKPKPRPTIHANAALAALRRATAPVHFIESPPAILEVSTRCGILDLTSTTCRWPIGVPGKPDFFFCGSKPHEGLPYCGYHSRRAYQPARAR